MIYENLTKKLKNFLIKKYINTNNIKQNVNLI